MNPGPMRHRVRLERQSTEQDDSGQPLDEWTLVAERWAELQAAPGREVLLSAQRQGRVPKVFRLRYLAGVTPDLRLVFGGVWHDIISAVDRDGRKTDLFITVEEHVGEAAT